MSEPAAVARVLDPARLPATSSRFDVAASLSASQSDCCVVLRRDVAIPEIAGDSAIRRLLAIQVLALNCRPARNHRVRPGETA
jgi:hypothetical protein